ncbi:hypothetical protein ADL35_36550, partial [Streptomyces sp. NRRL WC-3753]
SGVAAVAAWRAARQANQNARTANDTAAAAREIAEQVAKIEQDRHHRELTPVLTITLNRSRGTGQVPLLEIRLDGPQALGYLDQVDETYPPSGYVGGLEQWRLDRQVGQFLLWVRCQREGHEPWDLSARMNRPAVTVGGH